MDKLKDMANKFGGGSGEQQPQQQQQQQPGGGQQEDYLDKAFDSATQKAGYGGKLSRDQSEKITDGVRGAFEKATGKHVPDKFSN